MALTASEIRYEQAHITDNATTSIIAANVICFTVACCAISLRLVSRRLRRLQLGIDDYFAMLAMLFVAGFLATTFFGLHVGAGRHIILSKDPVAYAKITIAADVIYAMGVVPIKFSLIILYRRIFPNRQLHIALWTVGGVVVCMGIAADFLAVFGCVPLNASWDHSIKRRCIDAETWTTIYGLQNVVTDFVLLFLPMPLVWRLNMAKARKIQVSGILVLGAFASVSSIVRITVLKNISLIDATWADVGCHTWSMVELCMGITSACLPTMGPIFSYIKEHSSTTNGVSRRTFAPWRVTPKSGSETTASSKTSRSDFTTKRSKGHSSFTKLEDSQEDVERNWMALAPFDNANRAKNGAVEINAVPSRTGSHEALSFNGIKVTTDIQQNALKSSKS